MGDWAVKPTFEFMRLGDEVVELTGRVRLTADMRYEVELVDGRIVGAKQLTQIGSAEIGE